MNETNKPKKTKKTGGAKAGGAGGRAAAILAAPLLLLAAALFPLPAASAAETFTLPVKQTFTIAGSSSAADGTFQYRLSPAAGAPALAGGGVFTLTGTEEKQIEISFAENVAPGGPYGYTLRRDTPARPYYTLDDRVYRVNVYVTGGSQIPVNLYDGEVYAETGEASPKVTDFARFTHIYDYVPPGGGPPGGGPPGGGETGGETEGETGGETEGETGGETTEPERPDPPAPANGGSLIPGENGNYIEIGADGTPLGEWRWDEDEGVWIYDKYPPLAQTGQLRWPVPVMGVSGALLFLVGLFLHKRRERRENPAVCAGPGVRAGE
jgi:hypothetical protein